ncbi:DUF4190 domain-containing protein [Streptomyces sp. RKAG293]|uniref:DUF4190 domain-containing protein n=1 Tax=Streptomyces sp. RKAG293 TaxID=2893403 RepID=UPI0020336A46|nr:DUF4190 domain-containing protein [Streptomyces sp. RKAG293]MCM2423832.1 septum formation family protein [Streptomyces sp. RKAG293]
MNHPYPQQWAPAFPVPAPTTNGAAIASLVLALLCLPLVGLITGLVALSKIRRSGERGRGLAIAGITIDSLRSGLLVVGLIAGGLTGAQHGRGAHSDPLPGAARLTVGECFTLQDGTLQKVEPGETTYSRSASRTTTVPCTVEHDAEVAGTWHFDADSDSRYPGDDQISTVAENKCDPLVDGYAMDTWALPDSVSAYYFLPSRSSWAVGNRQIVCFLASDAAKLTRPLRADATVLSPDQVAYLKAVTKLNATDAKAPDTEAVKDLVTCRDFAARMAEALHDESAQLTARTWPAKAKQPVADMLAEIKISAGAWEDAATASDATQFRTHVHRAEDHMAHPEAVQVRAALGLSTGQGSAQDV